MANFRLAATERRYDRSRGDWVDGETNWVTVVAWRWLAANVVSSVNKGDPVVVCGRLRIREWDDGGKRRSAAEIDARVVGHDLGRGTSAFRWTVRGRSEPTGGRVAASAEQVHGQGYGPGPGRMQGQGQGRERVRVEAGGVGWSGGEVQPVGEAVPEWIVEAVRAHRAGAVASAEGGSAGSDRASGADRAVESGGAGELAGSGEVVAAGGAAVGEGGATGGVAAPATRTRRRVAREPAGGGAGGAAEETSETGAPPQQVPGGRVVARSSRVARGGRAVRAAGATALTDVPDAFPDEGSVAPGVEREAVEVGG
ncbi:hypothetical protein GCM10009665_68460 [Kitasatospora nipponensis]|uniref:Single-stranded DNA-binding protein n=2 Tax=Kitasatospora nipponensis TaxID=258049 RepID=A0ABN1WX19_9ACTN